MTTQEWLTATVKAICTKPEEVTVDKKVDEEGELYTIHVAQEDRGRIIGKKGQIADAVRIVLRAIGFKGDVRAAMTIDAPPRRFDGVSDEELGLKPMKKY